MCRRRIAILSVDSTGTVPVLFGRIGSPASSRTRLAGWQPAESSRMLDFQSRLSGWPTNEFPFRLLAIGRRALETACPHAVKIDRSNEKRPVGRPSPEFPPRAHSEDKRPRLSRHTSILLVSCFKIDKRDACCPRQPRWLSSIGVTESTAYFPTYPSTPKAFGVDARVFRNHAICIVLRHPSRRPRPRSLNPLLEIVQPLLRFR